MKINKIALVMAIIIFCGLISSCGGAKEKATLVTAIYLSEDQIKTECEIDGEVTPEKLAEKLSELTGLDFIISSTRGENDSVIIDWKTNSTLIANLDDREQKEEYFFFDSDSMRWFMMDTMWYTILENFGEVDVFYTMDGGNMLSIGELNPFFEFGTDAPYPGGTFLYNHVQGSVE